MRGGGEIFGAGREGWGWTGRSGLKTPAGAEDEVGKDCEQEGQGGEDDEAGGNRERVDSGETVAQEIDHVDDGVVEKYFLGDFRKD